MKLALLSITLIGCTVRAGVQIDSQPSVSPDLAPVPPPDSISVVTRHAEKSGHIDDPKRGTVRAMLGVFGDCPGGKHNLLHVSFQFLDEGAQILHGPIEARQEYTFEDNEAALKFGRALVAQAEFARCDRKE